MPNQEPANAGANNAAPHAKQLTADADASAAEVKKITRSTWLVSLLTMCSRILGLLRDKCLVLLFGGSTWVFDAFILAFTIPNLFRRLFGEGALTASFIPVFVRVREQEGEAAGNRLASTTITMLIAVTGAIAAAGMLLCMGADFLFSGQVGSDSAAAIAASQKISLSLKLTAVMLPFLCFICVSALLAGMLQSLRSFSLPAVMSIVLNFAFLGSFYYIYTNLHSVPAQTTIFYVAVAVVAAGLLQILIQAPVLLAKGVRLSPAWDLKNTRVKEVLKALGPSALGLGVVQVNVLMDNLIAYYLSLTGAEGANTYLYLGNRLMQLPLGVFGIAVASTVFPYLASDAGKDDFVSLAGRLQRSIRLLFFVLLPASLGLIAVASPLVRMIYQEPDLTFSDAAVYRTSAVLVCYAGGLIFFGLQHLFTRCFYALGDFTTPIKVAVWMVITNLGLNLILIHMPDWYRRWTHVMIDGMTFTSVNSASTVAMPLNEAGLALATAITALLNVCILWHFLKEKLHPKLPAKTWDDLLDSLGGAIFWITLASAGMSVIVYFTTNSIPAEPELLMRIERGLVPVVLGVVVYAILCLIIGIPELEELFGKNKNAVESTDSVADIKP